MTTAISEFTGQPVDTFSEEWRHECECRALLAMPSREARNRFLNGYTDHAGKKRPGVLTFRGQAGVDRLRNDAEKLFYLRRDRAAAAAKPAQPDLLSA